MLGEKEVLKLLKENFVVALDDHSTHNSVGFGVNIWIFTAEGKELKNYWYGTGNDCIGLSPDKPEDVKYRIDRHHRQTKEMLELLKDAVSNRIARLIKELDDENPERRDKATEELIKVGQGALEALRVAVQNPPSEEVKSRAASIFSKIEKQIWESSFKGGEIVCGLQATLRCEKDTFKMREEPKFVLEIKNVDSMKRDFVLIKGLDWQLPEEGSFASSSHAKIVVTQISGDVSTARQHSMGCGSGPEKSTVGLEPGETIQRDIIVSSSLVEGVYEIQIIYYAKSKKMLKDAPDDLKSNTIRFKVVKWSPHG